MKNKKYISKLYSIILLVGLLSLIFAKQNTTYLVISTVTIFIGAYGFIGYYFFKDKKKDSFLAEVSFNMSAFFFVPLFNIAICIAGMILAWKALKLNFGGKRAPGFGFALTAFILSFSGLILTIIGLIFYLVSDDVCGRAICQAFYQGQ